MPACDRRTDRHRMTESLCGQLYLSYHKQITYKYFILSQEAQLMLTSRRDAFKGQSRSPNMVPFEIFIHQIGSKTDH